MLEQNLLANYEQAQSLLAQEESATNTDRKALKEREARRDAFERAHNAMSAEIQRLWYRYRHLPDLPDTESMDWASAVLAFPNLRFVVIDTTGVDDHADIIRLFVADREGHATFDHLVRPERDVLPEAANSRYTGINSITLYDTGEALSALWHNFSESVVGHFVLCYNTEFVQAHLNESAAHYGLPPIRLIGEDLQKRATSFFQPKHYYPLKLVDVASRIGHSLPMPATAPDRASAQLAVLRAISEGNTGAVKGHETAALPEDEGESAF